MKCPRCQTVNSVFTFPTEKTDKCGRCSTHPKPQIVKCHHCGAAWCPPCWQIAVNPPPLTPPGRPRGGIADDAFDI